MPALQAEKAFAQARTLCPHLLESMDLYSTTLWHRRLSTPLSLLSQDLMLLSPTHSSSWIATGNTFSLNSDHSSALKCFKRAVQLDQNCVYAYTLAGHECVALEEWERATAFFREAIRRDSLHYNAW
jgi:anaphase-promoting complex subunit 3